MNTPGWSKWKKAAAVVLLAGAGLFYFSEPQQPQLPPCNVTAGQIRPECPQATSVEARIHHLETALSHIVTDLQQLSDHFCPPDTLQKDDPIKQQLDALKHNLLTTSRDSKDPTISDDVLIRDIQSQLKMLRSANNTITRQILEGGTIRPASKEEIETLIDRLDTRLKQLVDAFNQPPDFSHHRATLETFHEITEGLIEVFELLKKLC